MLFCGLLFSFKKFLEYHQSDKQFGSRSGPTSGLITDQTVRKGYQQTTLVGIELTLLILVPVNKYFGKQFEDPDEMPYDNQDLHCLLR